MSHAGRAPVIDLSLPAAIMIGPKRPPDDVVGAILACFAARDVAICVTDEKDEIRYVSPVYRETFMPQYDGSRSSFAATMETAIRNGIGVKLVTMPPGTFMQVIAERRRTQTGAFSFATDLCDGSWWWVTDVKLPNGWMVCVGQNISSLKHEEFRLRDAHRSAIEEAQTDSLTGIANRRRGLSQGEMLLRTAKDEHRPLSIALLDIDHFKPINDTHGHEAGDHALMHLAKHMTEASPPDWQFSRRGGDEFLLVLPDATLDMLYIALAGWLRRMPPLVLPGADQELRLSVSCGAAQIGADDDWSSLLRKADAALYSAKTAGRGRIACAR